MINTLPSPKSKQKRTQVGRGIGTGHGGHTAGRGTKGQKSRSGYSRPRPGFEGGQMPLSRRLPKLRGFSRGYFNSNIKKFNLQLSQVAKALAGKVVNVESLIESGMILASSKKIQIKILFDQKITEKLVIEGIEISKAAKAAVESAGGEVKSEE